MGAVSTGQVKYRFSVRTPAGQVFKESFHAGQDVVFVSQNKGEEITKFVQSLKPDFYYTVTLTVEIRQAKKGVLAVITDASAPLFQAK